MHTRGKERGTQAIHELRNFFFPEQSWCGGMHPNTQQATPLVSECNLVAHAAKAHQLFRVRVYFAAVCVLVELLQEVLAFL